MPWYLKAVWVQFNINTPVELVITILFYLLIPNGEKKHFLNLFKEQISK